MPKPEDILVFPDELRVRDESANRFLARAMKVCGDGQYEPFRLLWSFQEEPLPRGDFDRGWQAVQEIRIRAFRQVLLAGGKDRKQTADETAYVVFADVRLDPKHRAGERKPHREVALMLIREKGDWRLTKPPAGIRKWIKGFVEKAAPVDAKLDDGVPAIDGPAHAGAVDEQAP